MTSPASQVPSLEGRRFASATSVHGGDVDQQTVFVYHEADDLVWARYEGGSVRLGFLVGTRSGNELDFRYSHVDSSGSTANGHCHSQLEVDGGSIRLLETWDWESKVGHGTSTLVEIADPPG